MTADLTHQWPLICMLIAWGKRKLKTKQLKRLLLLEALGGALEFVETVVGRWEKDISAAPTHVVIQSEGIVQGSSICLDARVDVAGVGKADNQHLGEPPRHAPA